MCEMIMKQVDELAFENMSLIRRLAREKDRVSKYMYVLQVAYVCSSPFVFIHIHT